MKHFLYIAHDYSRARGFNRTIMVYRIKKNVPEFVGYNEQINTASYKGDLAAANKIIADVYGYKMTDGYRLDDKTVIVHNI